MTTFRRHIGLAAAVLACLTLTAVPAGGAEAPTYDRIHLLGADTDYLYWSTDPLEPEFASSTVTRTCGVRIYGTPNHEKPCLSGFLGGQFAHAIFFYPATLLDASPAWSAAAPLRFRLALAVESPLAYTVHFGIQKGSGQVESGPATEVAPGIWEGTIAAGSPLDPATVNIPYVRVRTLADRITMTLRTRGASYAQFPQPFEARPVSRLLADSTYRPKPTSFVTPQRSFTFNDDAWNARSFEGDLTQTRSFDLTLERDAAILVAWVEAYDTPFAYDVLTGGDPDTRKLFDTPVVRLYRGDEEVAHGGNEGETGRGVDTLATTAVLAGPLRLEVAPTEDDQTYPYRAYVVAVEGDRTLQSMRWRFTNASGFFIPHRTPVSAACPASVEPVPTTPETTTFNVDVDWDSQSLLDPGWTIRFSLPGVGFFPCGEVGVGDRVRFTVPGVDLWYFGATPAPGSTFASWQDTVLEMEVTYTYTPPPPPEEPVP